MDYLAPFTCELDTKMKSSNVASKKNQIEMDSYIIVDFTM
jgi:hypothetical protein